MTEALDIAWGNDGQHIHIRIGPINLETVATGINYVTDGGQSVRRDGVMPVADVAAWFKEQAGGFDILGTWHVSEEEDE